MVNARADGRSADEIRPLSCTRGLLNRAHGSARWSQGNTIVLAAVYGPKSVGGRHENSEQATVEVVWKSKSGPSTADKEAELVLRRTVEHAILATQHPNTGISVIIQVVSDDGSLLSCAVNAACAALVDAGIPLSTLLAAVTCGVSSTGQILLDPMQVEVQDLQACVTLVFTSQPASVTSLAIASFADSIVTSITRGAMPVDSYLDCLARGNAACKKITDFSRASIEKKQNAVEVILAAPTA